METATVVVLVSSYLEGPLVHGAIETALQATDNVLVFEGAAGEPLPAELELPASEFDRYRGRVRMTRGTWSTDAEKRTAMVREAARRYSPPVWALWLDGDELLQNPTLLADWCRYWSWVDELERRRDPNEPAMMGWPIRLVELDGSVALCRGKVVRVDLIKGYDVSSSVFTNALGFQHGEGNVPERLSENDGRPGFARNLELALSVDRMIVPSWLVAEPFLVHRSLLRHPLRAGLRLHEQEAVEIERAKRAELELEPGAGGVHSLNS